MKNLITILIILAVVACGQEKQNEPVDKTFHAPNVLIPATSDTIEYFQAEYITPSLAIFAGKSKFCDTIKFYNQIQRVNAYTKDYIDERTLRRSDSIRTDGLELFPDYKSSIPIIIYNKRKGKYFYPVHVVNQTPTTKVFIGKDGQIFAIQEALDKHRNWRPIEGRTYDFCGHGYWGLKINSNEFITILLPKYQGTYKTKIRVRIKIGDNIYVSHPFEGTINEKQFNLDKNGGYHKNGGYFYRELLENEANAIQDLFYGSKPLETQDHNFGRKAEFAQ